MEYLNNILSYFRNLALNAAGAERDLYQLIQDGDISKAIELMQNRDDEVDAAIKEYNPQTHDVMSRPNKRRRNADDYETEKLPRTRQRYINEVELFFLLGSPLLWKKEEGSDDAYKLFTDFIQEQRINTHFRNLKRLAGSETEASLLFHVYRDDSTNSRKVKPIVLARSTGYRLRYLFDQYGNLVAFAYGYKLRENGKTVQHWDIQTSDSLFFCSHRAVGWKVETYPNPTGKINIIFARQPKAWDGVERRIHREEMLDSKIGDTNNYFADPIAAATADVIDSLADPDRPGKLIQLTGAGSKFDYVNPPQNSEARKAEKQELHESILFDSFTPDFSFDKLKGMGTLSGAAIKNAMILGYIKRDNRLEIYDEIADRMKNVIIGILKYMHPEMEKDLNLLRISHAFQEPFAVDKHDEWQALSSLHDKGLLSLEQAVRMLALTDTPEEEIRLLSKSRTQQREPQDGRQE